MEGRDPLEAGNGKEKDYLLQHPEGTQPCQDLGFAHFELLTSRKGKMKNLHCFKPLRL